MWNESSERRSKAIVESDEDRDELMDASNTSDVDESQRSIQSNNDSERPLSHSERSGDGNNSDVDLFLQPPTPTPDLSYDPELDDVLIISRMEDEDDSFLPSQMPGGPPEVIFGRVDNEPDVEMIKNSSSDEDINVLDNGGRNSNNVKRRRNNNNTFTSIATAARNGKSSRSGSNKKSVISVQTRLKFKKRNSVRGGGGGDSNSESSSSEEIRMPRVPSTSSLTGRTNNSGCESDMISMQQQQRPLGEVLRLKIRVLEHTLLVPVGSEHLNETVEWLCEECAQRYLR
jgi:hypothetical protein